MNPTAEKMDSGSICGTDNKSNLLEPLSSTDMDGIRTLLFNRKAILRNSAKLKSQIHSHINDLIETLKERERQLFLEIDEHDIDCFLLMADKMHVDNLSVEKTRPSIDEDPKIPPSAFLQKKLKFVGNTEPLKTELEQFGQVEKVEEATNASYECLSDPTQVKKSRFTFYELRRKLSKKSRTKKAHKESTGSVESFEIIDGLDLVDYQKYIESLTDEDDIEVVSNPDEFQSWQPSFPIHEIGYSNGPKPKHHTDLISPVHNASEESSASSYQAPTQSPDDEKLADPVTQIHKQLRGLLHSFSCDEKCQEPKAKTSQLDEALSNLNNPLEQKLKSDGLSPLPSKIPSPSAITLKTFNDYLDQGGPDKWLAPSDNQKFSYELNSFDSRQKGDSGKWLASSDKLQSKFSNGTNSFDSHRNGLHFNITR